ncbi:calmodulin-interacting protein 111 [Impatiens glandulifera]|uniref:calmodulin-interacting protein 111 n=1 Tax=Impatiens glandulifera TaxID=253017 RepID=UPI001FB14C8D|nr:calmodulin-interacting protein 111 [Impatiens glandulifera]
MGSKSKKPSKAIVKRSNLEQDASPLNSLSLDPVTDVEASEEELRRLLEEAALRFPSLIGHSALIGRVTDSEVESKGCRIWLSESSMIKSSILISSLVSVSLTSARLECSNSFQLNSIADEFARNCGVDSNKKVVDEAGNYFVLATVYPLGKLKNDEVRLSSNLSSSLCYPASGRTVFVYPIPASLNKQQNENCLLISNCKELYLELATPKSDIDHSGPRSYHQIDNLHASSPATPINPRSKPTFSPVSHRSQSDDHESLKSNLTKMLEDESSKKLLQTCSTYWLHSRNLLYGNFVTIPINSKVSTFQVITARKITSSNSLEGLTGEDQDPEDLVDDAFLVNHMTTVHFSLPSTEAPQAKGFPSLKLEYEASNANEEEDFSKLGGLSSEYSILKDIIISSKRSTLSRLGLRPIKGVLIHGPPGTGKTSLIKKCVREADIRLYTVNGPEIFGQYQGESEQALHEVFDLASKTAPAVVFIDELDAIAPARREGGEELSQRMVATLLNLMDGIRRTDGLLVIAATNRPDSIEPALRRPGRLDREIAIGAPSPQQRHDILLALLSDRKHSLSDSRILNLATNTHGFVGADLEALCKEATFMALRRHIDMDKFNRDMSSGGATHEDCSSGTEDDLSGDTVKSAPPSITDLHLPLKTYNENLNICSEDFDKARMKVNPSAMREVILEIPMVKWEDVGGQKEIKAQLIEAVEWPQKHRDAFIRIGTRPPTGVLMFGPPGCSKTLLARAVASNAGLNFLAVKGPELFSKWVGESEKAVKSLFAKARANAPAIIFFDEIDGLAVIRGKENDGVSVSDRVMSQLLVEMDGMQQRSNVTVIAATNRPDNIDPALLRPGRFDRLIYVGPPSKSDREEIFHIHLRKMACGSDVCIEELALLTEGCTGADISLICREAALSALDESLEASEIRMNHFKTAIDKVEPTDIQSYEELYMKFERFVPSTARKDEIDDLQSSSTVVDDNHESNSSRSKWNFFGSLFWK